MKNKPASRPKRAKSADKRPPEQYRGTVSLPFERGKYGRVAFKIVDDRGIESLRTVGME